MVDATAEFLDALVKRGHEPLLEKTSGTVRFDLRDGRKTERWLVAHDYPDEQIVKLVGGNALRALRAVWV